MASSSRYLQVSNSGALLLASVILPSFSGIGIVRILDDIAMKNDWHVPVRGFYITETNMTVWRVITFGHLT